MAIINKSTGQPIPPEIPVNLMDLSGKVESYPASQAEILLQDPSKGLQVASPEQSSEYKDYVTYTKPTEKAKAFLEAAGSTATAGILPAIIESAMEKTNPAEAKKYLENKEKRAEFNYGTSTVGGLGGFLLPMGAAAQAEKIAAEVVGSGATSALGRIAQKTAQGFVAGGTYGATSEIVPRLIDQHPLTMDAIIDKTWKDALGFGVPHLVLAGAGEALNGVNAIKGKTLDYFKKGIGSIDKNPPPGGSGGGPITQGITVEELPKSENPFGKKAIALKTIDSPANEVSGPKTDYAHVEGNKTVKIDDGNLTGNGASFDSHSGLDKIGLDNGIEDFPAKYRTLKSPGETPKEFLLRTKLNQIKHDFLEQNILDLTPEERTVLANNKTALEEYKLNPDDPKAIANYGKSSIELEGVADTIQQDPKISKAIEKEVGNYLGSFDHIRADGVTHVFNPDVIKGDLTQMIGEEIKPEMKRVISELGITEKAQAKAGGKAVNTASEYAQSLFPKEGELNQGEHLIDHVIDKNEGNIAKFGANVGNVVNAAINRLEASGLNTRMTYADMAKFVDRLANEKYGDPISGNAQAGMTEQFNELKQYANELRNNGFIEKNKYGDPIHHPLNFSQLRDVRLKVDDIAFRGDAHPAIRDAAASLREFIEKHVMETLGQNSPDLQKAYSKAKLDYHTAKTMQVLLNGAAQKAVNRMAAGSDNIVGTMIAAKIAKRFFGPLGEIAAVALRNNKGTGIFNTVSEGATQQFSNALAETVKRYDAILSRAAFGMISEKPSQYTPLSPGKSKTYEEIKKDEKSLNNVKQSQEGYFNDFINRNNGSFTAAPNSMNGMVEKSTMAVDFLLSKAPQNPYKGVPFREDTWQPSQVEIDKYFRYKEAVLNPSNILKQLSNGYATPESIEVLNTLFPQTKDELSARVLQSMKKEVPQEKKVLLFKTFGIPMDSFSQGNLYSEMQSNANLMVQQELAQQNNMGQQVNTSKISDPMASLTTGQQSLSTQD